MASTLSRLPLRTLPLFFLEAVKIDTRSCVMFAKRSPTAIARLSILVPKRVVKLAVSRNRIKRVLRQKLSSSLSHLESVDIVIRMKNAKYSENDINSAITSVESIANKSY